MNVQVTQLAPIRVLMVRHTGPYEELSSVFDELWAWVESNHLPVQRTIGIYWDNPDFVAASRLRSAACVEIQRGTAIPAANGLPIEQSELAGGEYAITRFVGPYEELTPVWTDFTRYIERTLRRQISQNPAFEVYVNDASDTPAQQLITDLYMPLI